MEENDIVSLIGCLRKIKNYYLDLRDEGILPMPQELNICQRLNYFRLILTKHVEREVTLKGGSKYPDITFFIIRRCYGKVGLFSMYRTIAGQINYAVKHRFVPIVDLKYINNVYKNSSNPGPEKNVWDYFFEQPYSIEEAYMGKNIVLSDLKTIYDYPSDNTDFLMDKERLAPWKKIVRQYMRVKEEFLAETEAEYRRMTVDGDRVLGVAIRGTDYVSLRPPEHPVQPDIETVINDTKKLISEKGFTKIYLSTEDEKYVQLFQDIFKEKLIRYERRLVNYEKGQYIMDIEKDRAGNEKIKGARDYLISILLLAKSDYLLASAASSVVAAEIMDNDFEDSYVYDLGRYPKK